MGFLRKATWVATGGASGVAFKANSKKDRTARALEEQNRLIKEQMRLQAAQAGTATARPRTLAEKRQAKQERQRAVPTTSDGLTGPAFLVAFVNSGERAGKAADVSKAIVEAARRPGESHIQASKRLTKERRRAGGQHRFGLFRPTDTFKPLDPPAEVKAPSPAAVVERVRNGIAVAAPGVRRAGGLWECINCAQPIRLGGGAEWAHIRGEHTGSVECACPHCERKLLVTATPSGLVHCSTCATHADAAPVPIATTAPEVIETRNADPSVTDELERLAVLHRDGALSDAEFQAAKSHLLEG